MERRKVLFIKMVLGRYQKLFLSAKTIEMIGDWKQIQMQKWATSKDAQGNNVENVVQNINTWAEISRSGGDRSSLNGQSGLTNYFIFRMRFQQFDPTGNWRIIYDRRVFAPHSIEKEHQRRFYWIIKAEANNKR